MTLILLRSIAITVRKTRFVHGCLDSCKGPMVGSLETFKNDARATVVLLSLNRFNRNRLPRPGSEVTKTSLSSEMRSTTIQNGVFQQCPTIEFLNCSVDPFKPCGYLDTICTQISYRHGIWTDKYAMSAYMYLLYIPFVLFAWCSRSFTSKNSDRNLMDPSDAESTSSLTVHAVIHRTKSTLNRVYMWLFSSFAFRVVWLVFKATNFLAKEERVVKSGQECGSCLACSSYFMTRFLNRFSILFFFTAYSLVAMFWLEVWGNAEARSLRLRTAGIRRISTVDEIDDLAGAEIRCCGCCPPRILIMILNAWVYVVEMIIEAMYWVADYPDQTYKLMKDYNYMFVSGFFLVLTFVLIFSGCKLQKLIRDVEKEHRESAIESGTVVFQRSWRMRCNITVMIVVFACSFLLRAFVFLARPLLCFELPDATFPYLFYPIPDLLPTFFFMYLTTGKSFLKSCFCACCMAVKALNSETKEEEEAMLLSKIESHHWTAQDLWKDLRGLEVLEEPLLAVSRDIQLTPPPGGKRVSSSSGTDTTEEILYL